MVPEKYYSKTKINMFFMILYEDQSIKLIKVSSFTEKHKCLKSKLSFIRTTINYCMV